MKRNLPRRNSARLLYKYLLVSVSGLSLLGFTQNSYAVCPITLGINDNAVGVNVGVDVSGNGNNVAGNNSGNCITGDANNAAGNHTGNAISGDANNNVGNHTGNAISGNANNTVGDHSGNRVSGDANSVLGDHAGNGVSGNRNSTFGYRSGNGVEGSANNVQGDSSGNGVTGYANSSLGNHSGNGVEGSANLALGNHSGNGVVGSANAALGNHSGNGVLGSGNFVIGNNAGNNNPFSDTVTIGNGASPTASHQIMLGSGQQSIVANGNFMITPGHSVNLGGGEIMGVGTPLLGTDAANKAYVDNQAAYLSRKFNDVRDGVAIALSIQNPDLVAGERFGISTNFGTFNGSDAFGIAAQGVIGQNFIGIGDRIALTGGVGFSTSGNNVAGRAGFQFTW